MAATLRGKEQAYKAAMASIEAAEARFALNVSALCEEIDSTIKSLTPVNTGQAVRNYIWSRDVPNTVVYEAIDNGPTGHTNQMALGIEPRRKPNEEAAHQSLIALGLGVNPFGVIYLTNLSPDIEGLEAGLFPEPPLRQRSPQGMFGVTAAYVRALVESKGMLS